MQTKIKRTKLGGRLHNVTKFAVTTMALRERTNINGIYTSTEQSQEAFGCLINVNDVCKIIAVRTPEAFGHLLLVSVQMLSSINAVKDVEQETK